MAGQWLYFLLVLLVPEVRIIMSANTLDMMDSDIPGSSSFNLTDDVDNDGKLAHDAIQEIVSNSLNESKPSEKVEEIEVKEKDEITVHSDNNTIKEALKEDIAVDIVVASSEPNGSAIENSSQNVTNEVTAKAPEILKDDKESNETTDSNDNTGFKAAEDTSKGNESISSAEDKQSKDVENTQNLTLSETSDIDNIKKTTTSDDDSTLVDKDDKNATKISEEGIPPVVTSDITFNANTSNINETEVSDESRQSDISRGINETKVSDEDSVSIVISDTKTGNVSETEVTDEGKTSNITNGTNETKIGEEESTSEVKKDDAEASNNSEKSEEQKKLSTEATSNETEVSNSNTTMTEANNTTVDFRNAEESQTIKVNEETTAVEKNEDVGAEETSEEMVASKNETDNANASNDAEEALSNEESNSQDVILVNDTTTKIADDKFSKQTDVTIPDKVSSKEENIISNNTIDMDSSNEDISEKTTTAATITDESSSSTPETNTKAHKKEENAGKKKQGKKHGKGVNKKHASKKGKKKADNKAAAKRYRSNPGQCGSPTETVSSCTHCTNDFDCEAKEKCCITKIVENYVSFLFPVGHPNPSQKKMCCIKAN